MNDEFFSRNPDVVAKELLGKILVRKIGNKELRGMIVETEAYFGEGDPASRASKGVNKVSLMMKESPGKILVYNVHKYNMLNFVTCDVGVAGAVLIRAIEPLNFSARTSGPGLLTDALQIGDEFHGREIGRDLFIEGNPQKVKIVKSFRIGVSKDLPDKMRFFIKGNKFVSCNGKRNFG